MGSFAPSTTKLKGASGQKVVTYRDTRGRTWDAVVIGAGSVSGLKLQIRDMDRKTHANQIKDNVAIATGAKQTNRYFRHVRQA